MSWVSSCFSSAITTPSDISLPPCSALPLARQRYLKNRLGVDSLSSAERRLQKTSEEGLMAKLPHLDPPLTQQERQHFKSEPNGPLGARR